MSLTLEDLKILQAPFDEKTLGIKVQALSKNKDRAMLVCYLQHTDVAARLDAVDPCWSARITSEGRDGENCVVRMQLSLKGVVREGIGDGQDAKSAASDALKRTAMLFGVGRYLYDADTPWVAYNDATDRFKVWAYAEYKAALRPGQVGAVVGASSANGASPVSVAAPRPTPVREREQSMTRMELGAAITRVAKAINLSEREMGEWIQERYNKPMSKLSHAEMEDFHGVLQGEQLAKEPDHE